MYVIGISLFISQMDYGFCYIDYAALLFVNFSDLNTVAPSRKLPDFRRVG